MFLKGSRTLLSNKTARIRHTCHERTTGPRTEKEPPLFCNRCAPFDKKDELFGFKDITATERYSLR